MIEYRYPQLNHRAFYIVRSYEILVNNQLDGDLKIRTMRQEDAPKVRQICCDNGFLGAAVEPLCSDREVFADLMVDAYLKYTLDWSLVAERDAEVVAYLLGAPPNFDLAILQAGANATLRMIAKEIAGTYHDDPQNLHFLHWLLFRAFRERPLRPSNAAHMHFNVQYSERGHAIGRYLWQGFEELLMARDILVYYGEFFSWPRHRPEIPYRRYGLEVYDRKTCSLFDQLCDFSVDTVCVWKRLVQ